MYHNKVNSLQKNLQHAARLNLQTIPSFCYIHDKINHEKRLMKSEFVQVVN